MTDAISLSPHDAAIALRRDTDALLDAPESIILGVVDATVDRHGPGGLYQIACLVGLRIVGTSRALSVHVGMSPHAELRTVVHAFLCALSEDMFRAAKLFHEVVLDEGECSARKVVCSLLWIARSVRDGIRRATYP